MRASEKDLPVIHTHPAFEQQKKQENRLKGLDFAGEHAFFIRTWLIQSAKRLANQTVAGA